MAAIPAEDKITLGMHCRLFNAEALSQRDAEEIENIGN